MIEVGVEHIGEFVSFATEGVLGISLDAFDFFVAIEFARVECFVEEELATGGRRLLKRRCKAVRSGRRRMVL
jgi:hypothetical protein